MLYVKLSCEVLTDGKILAVGPDGLAMWLRGLLYAKQHLTDGFIPTGALPLLALGVRDPEHTVSELVRVGLWIVVDGGHTVGPDRWARHQVTREEVEAKREAATVRKQRSRERSRGGHASVTHRSRCDTPPCHAVVTPHQGHTTPEPEPEPEPEPDTNTHYSNARQQRPPDTGEIDTHTRSAEARVRRSDPQREPPGFPAFWAAYPRKVAQAAARKAWNALAPDEVTQAAIQRALAWQRSTVDWTRDGGRYVPYPATWLRAERWLDEHHTTTEDSDDQMLWGWECTNAACPDGRFHRTTRADKPADYRCPHLPRLVLVGGATT